MAALYVWLVWGDHQTVTFYSDNGKREDRKRKTWEPDCMALFCLQSNYIFTRSLVGPLVRSFSRVYIAEGDMVARQMI